MSIPLYLKLKGHLATPTSPALFLVVSGTSIEYNSRSYAFTKIFGPDSSLEELNQSNDSCVIFMGPTGSGKTTTFEKVITSRLIELNRKSYDVSITAFEVTENKYIVDLLDGAKKDYNPLTFEKLLKSQKLNGSDLVHLVFSKRLTSRTPYNDTSSRSCLVITFHWNNLKCTYIDLMGNEKFDKSAKSPGSNRSSGPHSPNSTLTGTAVFSNIFANMNMSSITQLLTKKSISGRSSNLVANLIFKNDIPRNVNIVLTLDQFGDHSLVKSSMNNIADLIHTFKLNSPLSGPAKSSSDHLPSYARPTLSSSPSKRPGLSKGYLSPKKVLGTSTPTIARKLNTPAKLKLVPALNRPSIAPKSTTIQKASTIISTPTRAAMQALNSSPVARKISGTDLGPPIKLASIHKTLSPVQLSPRAVSDFCSSTPKPARPTSALNLIHKKPMSNPSLSHPSNIMPTTGIMKRPTVPRVASTASHSNIMKALQNLQTEYECLTIQHQEQLGKSQEMKKRSELEISDLKLINETNQALLAQQKELMNSKLNELKGDFRLFRTHYGNFKYTIENLKISLCLMEEENLNLKDLNSMQSTELISFNDQLELSEINHGSLKYECDKVSEENDKLKMKLIDLEKANLQLIERESEKEVIILENTKELSEKADEILDKDKQLSIKDSLIVEKNYQLQEKDDYISELTRRLVEKDTQLAELNRQVCERDLVISQRDHELSAKAELISLKEKFIDSSNQRLRQTIEQNEILQQKIQSQVKTVEKLVQSLRDSEQTIDGKDHQIKILTEDSDRIRGESEQLGCSVSTEIAIKDSHILSLSEQTNGLQLLVETQGQEVSSLQKRVSELQLNLKDHDTLRIRYEEKVAEVYSLNKTLDQRLEEIAQLGNELRSFQYNQESKMEDLNDELANTSSELITKDDQIANLEKDRETLAVKVNDLKDQLTAATTHWIQKFENTIKSKDDTISQLRQKLDDEIRSPLLTNIDLISTSLSSFTKPFDPCDIFQDNILCQSSRDTSIMENDALSSSTLNTLINSIDTAATLKLDLTKKKILTPTKSENYKTVVNAMTKEKKFKKKSKLAKYKVNKVPTNSSGNSVINARQKA